MVNVSPKEQIELCNAVESLFDDASICISTKEICDEFETYTAICIETEGWNRNVLIRINEMCRDVRLGFYTQLDIARTIVMLYDAAYRYRTNGALVTVGK